MSFFSEWKVQPSPMESHESLIRFKSSFLPQVSPAAENPSLPQGWFLLYFPTLVSYFLLSIHQSLTLQGLGVRVGIGNGGVIRAHKFLPDRYSYNGALCCGRIQMLVVSPLSRLVGSLKFPGWGAP